MYDCVVCGGEGGKEGKGVLQARHSTAGGTHKSPLKKRISRLYIPSLLLFFDLGVRLGKHVVGTGRRYMAEAEEKGGEREKSTIGLFSFLLDVERGLLLVEAAAARR